MVGCLKLLLPAMALLATLGEKEKEEGEEDIEENEVLIEGANSKAAHHIARDFNVSQIHLILTALDQYPLP